MYPLLGPLLLFTLILCENEADTCGGNFFSHNGTFHSPNFPELYEPSEDCTWYITVAEGQQIMLWFKAFETEYHRDCRFDFVRVFEGHDANNSVLGTYCGIQTTFPVRSSKNKMAVKFHSDAIIQKKGFLANFTTAETCGGNFISDNGTFHSRNFPEPYEPNEDCTWNITVAEDQRIVLWFESFETEDSDECSFDFVRVFDGHDANSFVLGTYCGTKELFPVRSSKNKMAVKFHSDRITQKSGFFANFTTEDICGENFFSDNGAFHSPNFPEPSEPNEHCTWNITVAVGRRIVLWFESFETEDECSFDSVRVFDGHDTNSPVLETFCGRKSIPPVYSSKNKMAVKFRSDEHTEELGFVAYFTTTICGENFSSSYGSFHTPNYPNPYPPFVACLWKITVAKYYNIVLQFETFKLPERDLCNSSSVKVFDGYDAGSLLLDTFCGDNVPEVFRSPENKIAVVFQSHNASEYNGFLANFSEVISGGKFVSDIGTFHSPNYPKNYPPQQAYMWKIAVREDHQVFLRFLDFDLDYEILNCQGDFVRIIDGHGKDDPISGSFCGSENPGVIISSKNEMTVLFESDDYFEGRGYLANFKAVNTCLRPINPTTYQNWVLYQDYCYMSYTSESLTWYSAKKFCQDNGAFLASIHSAEEQNFLFGLYGRDPTKYGADYWIGLRDKDSNSRYEWDDDTHFNFTKWDDNDIYDSGDSTGTCVSFNKTTGFWIKNNCHAVLSVICKIKNNYEPVFSTPLPPLSYTGVCPDGWEAFGNKCFRLFGLEKSMRGSWLNAKERCSEYGSTLVSVHSKEELEFLTNFMGQTESVWIGLSRVFQKVFNWVDNSVVDFTSWDKDEPNDAEGKEECVEMYDDGKWNDVICSYNFSYICETLKVRQCEKIKSSEHLTWLLHEDYCYSIPTTERFTWQSAKKFCQENGAFLVTINSIEENRFLYGLNYRAQTGDSFWTGLRSRGLNSSYKWEDGTSINFSNWNTENESEESSHVEKCVASLRSTGHWVKNDCNILLPTICKVREDYDPVFPTPDPEILGFCPDGWYMLGQTCYRLFGWQVTEREAWINANQKCIELNSTLVSIHNRKQQEFLALHVVSTVSFAWIGMKISKSTESLQWTDNSVVDYAMWSINQPGLTNELEECVMMNMIFANSGKWGAFPCFWKFPYVCQKLKDSTMENPGKNPAFCAELQTWQQFDSSCYKTFKKNLSWTEAQKFCGTFEGNLVTIRYFAVAKLLMRNLTGLDDRFWIGMNNMNSNGYTWIGTSSLDYYSNWQPGQPSAVSDGNNCVAVNKKTEWIVTNCNESHAFICEVRKGYPSTTLKSSDAVCLKGWKDFGTDYCYIIEWERKFTWHEAAYQCIIADGKLAVFHTSDELSILISFMRDFPESLHIGMKKGEDGIFTWNDKSPVDYNLWGNNKSDDLRKECVELYTEYPTWRDIDCSTKRGYICSAPKNPHTDAGATAEKDPVTTSRTQIAIFTSVTLIVTGLLLALLFYLRRFYVLKKLQEELLPEGSSERRRINPDIPIQDQADLIPYDKKWEFPKSRLKFGRTLGQGAFGRVVKAKATGLYDFEPHTKVAVKILKDRTDVNQQRALITELKVLIHLGHHLNILNLLGAVTKVRSGMMIVVEYCRYGNLRQYLLKHRRKFIPQNLAHHNQSFECSSESSSSSAEEDDVERLGPQNSPLPKSKAKSRLSKKRRTLVSGLFNVKPKPGGYASESSGSDDAEIAFRRGKKKHYLTVTDLICYGYQCTKGMFYLSSLKFIHRDLAARNILLAENNVVKISDFGLTKDLYDYPNDEKKDAPPPLPIKWMALESIGDRVFTTKSDVWSFGILLWEIFSLGAVPYPGIPVDNNFFNFLKEGNRMEKPEHASDTIYQIMMDCWNATPARRPNFSKLCERLGDLLEDVVKNYYLDLNEPYQKKNLLNLEYSRLQAKKCDESPGCDESSTIVEDRDATPSVTYISESSIQKKPMEEIPMVNL